MGRAQRQNCLFSRRLGLIEDGFELYERAYVIAHLDDASALKATRVAMPACSRLSILPFATGPKRSIRRLLGLKKIIFLIREIDDAAMAAASMESCQFVVLRCPGGRLGSVVDVRNRRRRVCGRFHRWIQISTGPQQCADNYHDPPKFSIQSSVGSTKHRRTRPRGPPDPRSILERVRAPICVRKK